MRTDVSFLSHVLFSDEANFANTGKVNRPSRTLKLLSETFLDMINSLSAIAL